MESWVDDGGERDWEKEEDRQRQEVAGVGVDYALRFRQHCPQVYRRQRGCHGRFRAKKRGADFSVFVKGDNLDGVFSTFL